MVRTLLVRGMLAGLIAGLLAFGMAKGFSEPSIDRAIAFETQEHDAKKAAAHAEMSKMPMAQDDANGASHTGMAGMAMPADDDDVELVSRPVQSGIGLFTGVMTYSVGIGGLFALVYAYAQGRTGRIRPRTLSLLLAAAGLVAVIVVPQLKYP